MLLFVMSVLKIKATLHYQKLYGTLINIPTLFGIINIDLKKSHLKY